MSPTWHTLTRLLGALGQELRATAEVAPVLDPQELDDTPRILRLSPEDRLREVEELSLFFGEARRA